MSTPWSETEKANIRNYLMFPSLFHQFEPMLENAINAVQAIADGGALPTDATQVRMRAGLSMLASIEQQITCLYDTTDILEADQDKVKMDAIRAIYNLKIEGDRIIKAYLCAPLGTKPVYSYFFPENDNDFEFGTGHSSASRMYPFFGKASIF